ncbi:hypothetical protein SAMN05421846_11454 [Chryseobacterium taeanense]|uniref:Pentapeptide repeat-containing protein n=1 Tax=Chryseobacterium taeanense TaxID=311334 RepID=A0A1G8NN11_9FLAO|nr:hypothetical protein [Chryseobacterium taeanense]SDI81527.1 hypothetical protein SAMN05421846_11454 [Chryseobacterium taeanense]
MTRTTISSNEFVELLKNPTTDILSTDYNTKIIFENYKIVGQAMHLDETINISLPVIIKNCSFELEQFIFFSECKFQENIMFSECSIKNGIFMKNAILKKDFDIKFSDIQNIDIWDGEFKNINFDTYNSKKFAFYRVSFENFNINSNKLEKLVIYYGDSNSGNIAINNLEINNITISGNLKNKSLKLEDIKCNNFLLDNFNNNGILHLANISTIINDQNNGYFQIVDSNLEKGQFFRIDFKKYNELVIIDSFISDCLFINCSWKENLRALKGPNFIGFENTLLNNRKLASSEYPSIKENYRQLKISMSKLDDKINENRFYKNELNYHNKTIKWSSPLKNDFWDKVILILSNSLSEYGQSFIKPFLYLLLGHLTLFLIAISLNGFNNLQISLFDWSWDGLKFAFEKFFIYINPLRKTDTSFSGYLIIIDILMRIWSSYMIYNIVRATRRFIN